MEHSTPPLFKQGPSAFVRLLICVALSCGLLVSDAHYRLLETVRQAIGIVLYPFQQAALWPRDRALDIVQIFTTSATLRAENESLTARNLKLALDAQQAAQLEIENTHLRALLQLMPRVAVGAIVAEVRYEARDPFIKKVIVDRGERDGVQIGSAVVDDEGVLGQVTRVYPLQSEVTLITDKDQSVPVQLIRTGMRSLVSGSTRGEGLVMRFVPVTADVQPGDELVTSGLDGVFPTGVPVAKIMTVQRLTGIEFAQVSCMPVALTRGPRQVLILAYKKPVNMPPHTDINPSVVAQNAADPSNSVPAKGASQTPPAPPPPPKASFTASEQPVTGRRP